MPSVRETSADKRKSHGFTPYNQSGRRPKMASLRNWSPAIWNALTFWKNGSDFIEEYDENRTENMPNGQASGSSRLDNHIAPDDANGGFDDTADSRNSAEGEPNGLSSTSKDSERQVSVQLFPQSPRHANFELPNVDQSSLNSQLPQNNQQAQQRLLVTPGKQSQLENYIAPIPPSSLRHLANSGQDPLTQVVDFITNRDNRPLNHVEALGLNSLIQRSVYQAGRPTAAQFQRHPNTLNSTSSISASSVSPSPPSIPPTFTTPNMDLTALATPSPQTFNLGPHATPMTNQTSPNPATPPSRTLARNPNGTLYYQGGGSARPRYRSPSFNASPTRKKVAFPRSFGDSPTVNGSQRQTDTVSHTDSKRRRVDQERDSSIPQSYGSTSTLKNGINGVDSTPAPTTPVSLRFNASTPGPRLLANTPSRPSPLRQSVRADSRSPSTSPNNLSSESLLTKSAGMESPMRARASEKASEIMAGIINGATPKKDSVPDVRNPYQSSSRNSGKRTRKVAMTKAPRPPPRPARLTASPPPTPQPKKLSALETIQRTAPQKQPSFNFDTPPVGPTTIPSRNELPDYHDKHSAKSESSADKPIVIEIGDESEEENSEGLPAKKQRQESGGPVGKKGLESLMTPEITDVDMDEPVKSSAQEAQAGPGGVIESGTEHQTQEDKRPLPTGPFSKKGFTARFQSVPKDPSPLRQSFQADTLASPQNRSPFPAFRPPPFSQESSSYPPAQLSTTSTSQSPPPAFNRFVPPVMDKSTPIKPNIIFTPTMDSSTDWLTSAKKLAQENPVDALPTFVFTFANKTISDSEKRQHDEVLAIPVQELPKFDFDGPPTSKNEVTPLPAVKAEFRPFDFKAAGMKPIVSSGWTCVTCLVKNEEHVTKCVSCESIR